MKYTMIIWVFALALPYILPAHADGKSKQRFSAQHVFDLEYARDPQISPNGQTIVYVRRSMDRMTDTERGDIWQIDVKSGMNRPLISGGASVSGPRWSPDGTKLLYSTTTMGRPDLRIHFMDTGDSMSLGTFTIAPRDPAWSPDGTAIAFSMFTPSRPASIATPIAVPRGAEWSKPVRVYNNLMYRFDGAGYLHQGAFHVYTVPVDGGAFRQVTNGQVSFGAPTWLGDEALLVTGNDSEDRATDLIESEIYQISLDDLTKTAFTDRDGPDTTPKVSPDGTQIAYLGYDDKLKSYQRTGVYLMNADGTNHREIAPHLDRSVSAISWSQDGASVYAQIENAGDIELIRLDLDGDVETLISGVGGTSLGRPYTRGSFSVSNTSQPVFAYTAGFSDRPAEIAVWGRRVKNRVLTNLNADILPHIDLATVEEVSIASSTDGREIEAWIVLPPDFTADGSFPMILEIHGGPFFMYGPYFAAEIQRYAAEGYVTVYANPRGSTGYGEAFSQLIDQEYPGHDFDDLMDVVDYAVAHNYVDEERLFITGGSGGGLLTAWAVGKTDRFSAAAAVKPVINWMTMALTADIGPIVRRHWIRSDPWSNPEAFLERSPISYAENVKTPTLIMVGEEDWRTPASEAEQFYSALKTLGVETTFIRIPGASHSITERPSRLIAKTDNILGWFSKFDKSQSEDEAK